ncbi:hypothetical protein [Yoonia sp. MH D7]
MLKYAIGGLAFGLVQFTATAALAQNYEVTIVNQTGYTMVEFFGSNQNTSSWEEDILGEDVLEHSASVDVTFDDGTGNCIYDFLAVFEDGENVRQDGIDVCTIGTFTFE